MSELNKSWHWNITVRVKKEKVTVKKEKNK